MCIRDSKWDKVNYLQEPGLELVIPKGLLYDDSLLNYSVRADSGVIAFTYQLNDTSIPMHKDCDLRIGLRRRPVEDVTKYYVAGVTARGGKYRIGGKYEDGVMKEMCIRDRIYFAYPRYPRFGLCARCGL